MTQCKVDTDDDTAKHLLSWCNSDAPPETWTIDKGHFNSQLYFQSIFHLASKSIIIFNICVDDSFKNERSLKSFNLFTKLANKLLCFKYIIQRDLVSF